jgi:outer membrane protein TolC
MSTKTLQIVVAIGSAVALLGCDRVGQIDPTLLNRYQVAMESRESSLRKPQEPLGLLRPPEAVDLPKLNVSKDPQTGKSRIRLTLDQVVSRTLANSQDILVVSYDPSANRQDIIKADAAFDAIVFAAYQYQKQEQFPYQIGQATDTKSYEYEVGVKGTTTTGAQWQIAHTMTRTWDNSAFDTFNTRFEPSVQLQFTQPLLRNAGPEFNLANLKIAKLTYQTSVAAFRQKIEEMIDTAIGDYWQLVQARQQYEITRALLDKTLETYERVKNRSGLDATAVEIKQAEAAVESRRATLIAVEKAVYDAQDNLVRLMADSQINLLGNYEIIPDTPPGAEPVKFDMADQLATALAHNPALEQARLAISTADVHVVIAKNQALPKIDLTGAYGITGGDGGEDKFQGSYSSLANVDFQNYSIGLNAEYPPENRAALADVRHTQLDRLKAIATLQNTADQVAVQVKERIRQIDTTALEVRAQRAAVEANRVQLQALEDTERIKGKLTPEFLQLKLQAQESLANAQSAELTAIVNFNTALTDLSRATGTLFEQQRVQIALPAVIGERPWPKDSVSPATVPPSQVPAEQP